MDAATEQELLDAYRNLPFGWRITSNDAQGEAVRRFMSAARDYAALLAMDHGDRPIEPPESFPPDAPDVGIMVPVGGTRPTLSAQEFAALMGRGTASAHHQRGARLRALSAEEWAGFRKRGVLLNPSIDDVAALDDHYRRQAIAVCNDQLPDSDRRKITRTWVNWLREEADVLKRNGAGAGALMATEIADALESYLPPA